MNKKYLKLDLQFFGDKKSKDKLEARVGEIENRSTEIESQIETGEGEFKELRDELEKLDEEKRDINDRLDYIRQLGEARNLNNGKTEGRTVETFNPEEGTENRDNPEEIDWEKRGTDIYEKRAVTVDSGDLIIPKHDSANIKGTFNQVSSLIDRVSVVPLQGGESYETPYEVEHGEGNYTAEGQPYHDVDIEFGYAKINKTKVTAYNEITEEVLKLPRANYGQRVVESVRQSLRKKITKEILNGRGPAEDEFVGIFSDQATAINPATDMEVSEINEDTLENIIYAYGGDEDVEGEFSLILSKDDLRQFSKLRHNDGRKVYDITHNGNSGTIDGVSYVINSGAGSMATATEGDYLMAYGPLSNYEMAVFSPTDVKRSDDVKFKEGMVAHRGSVFSGGNVVSFNGFLRVKKGVESV